MEVYNSKLTLFLTKNFDRPNIFSIFNTDYKMTLKKDDNMPTIIITVIGDESAERTLTLLCFQRWSIQWRISTNNFENSNEIHTYEGKQYNIHLWDTVGQYSKLHPLSYVKANVILFAFDGPNSLK